MYIRNIRHDWPQKAGFIINRPDGISQYSFLHFHTPVMVEINGEIIRAHPGACIIFEPRYPKHYYAEVPLVSNWFRAKESFRELLSQYDVPVNCIFYPKDTSYISGIIRAIEIEFFSDDPHRETMINCYLTELLIRLSRNLQNTAKPTVTNSKEQAKLQELRKQILSMPEKKWTIAEMASSVSLSQSRFHAVYKAMFGTSPMRDLIDAKVDYAKTVLLTKEHMPLSHVAELLGYNDQFHFIRQFKTVTGMTPGAYRKINR